jgi:hypothetical protein
MARALRSRPPTVVNEPFSCAEYAQITGAAKELAINASFNKHLECKLPVLA